MTSASGEPDYGPVTARHYDAIYAILRDPSGDVAWYRRLAREAGGPVLELGAGTGRVLLSIAAEGIPCTGLDRSAHMLEALRRKTPPAHVRLVRAPMHDFDLGDQRFALIYSAFRAFQHLECVEDQLACLRCVRRHLAAGGRFAFDVFAPDLERTARVEEPEREDGRYARDGEEVVRYSAVRRDHARQLLHVRMRYERRRDGRVLGEERVAFRMRYFFRYELEHLLARAGFDALELYGDYDGRPYDASSGEFAVVARCAAAT